MADDQHNMIFSPKECETVIVLGAGASRHAGLPLLADFHAKMTEVIRRGDLSQECRKMLRKASDLFDQYRCPDSNLETLFSTVSAAATLGSRKAMRERNRLARAIAITYELTMERQITESRDLYALLARLLGRMNPTGETPKETLHVEGTFLPIHYLPLMVITFNGDVAFDMAMANTFASDGSPMLLYSWLAERERLSFRPLRKNCESMMIKAVRSLRPHGCLSWGVCPVCSRVQVMALDPSVQPSPDFYRKVTHTTCNWHTGEERPKLEPCIIAPTWDKRTTTPDLQGIWAATAQALMQCEKLLVIGFSLPPTDANVNSMFRFALSRNQKLSGGKVMIVDDCCKTIHRWQSMVNDTNPGARFERTGKYFEKSLDQIKDWLL